MSEQNGDAMRMYGSIKEYCDTYNIPLEKFLDILEDQKVLPMIRGKATEYIGAAILKQALSGREWDVHKLNLNPQPDGKHDEDITIVHRRTGMRLKAETKNAVRGGFKLKTRGEPTPHVRVKCHKSRSNLKKAHNDRYEVNTFDVLLFNISNAIFKGKTTERGLLLIDKDDSISWLKQHYHAAEDKELIRKAYDDWRICLPETIAMEDGTIPRTPVVKISDDPNWFEPNELESRLQKLINARQSAGP